MSDEFDPGLIERKETVWCTTETGPFKFFLMKIGKEDDDTCRRCGQARETA